MSVNLRLTFIRINPPNTSAKRCEYEQSKVVCGNHFKGTMTETRSEYDRIDDVDEHP